MINGLVLLLVCTVCVAASETVFGHHQARVNRLLESAPARLRNKPKQGRRMSSSLTLPFSSGSSSSFGGSGSTGLTVFPADHGGDPTGQTDSTAALLTCLSLCINVTSYTTGTFSEGIRDMGGCTIDLQGGEYLISKPLVFPQYTANARIQSGSLVASKTFPSDQFMIYVGNASGPCTNGQGSCNLKFSFAGLFVDGSRTAMGAFQINHVMGTTIGPDTYVLNYTQYGVQVNGGHEVMISETWLGEVNFDYSFSSQDPPKSVGVQINSNDHYMEDTIVFAAKTGLQVGGAANYFAGVHVWFPENQADQFDATAFYVSGSQNRFVGCYVDGSRLVLNNPDQVTFTQGFFLEGATGVVFQGTSVNHVQITQNEFMYGSVAFSGAGITSVKNTVIDNNMFSDGYKAPFASRFTKFLSSTTPISTWSFDFSKELIFPTIDHVTFSLESKNITYCVSTPPVGATVSVICKDKVAGKMSVFVDASTSTLA